MNAFYNGKRFYYITLIILYYILIQFKIYCSKLYIYQNELIQIIEFLNFIRKVPQNNWPLFFFFFSITDWNNILTIKHQKTQSFETFFYGHEPLLTSPRWYYLLHLSHHEVCSYCVLADRERKTLFFSLQICHYNQYN